MKLDHHTPNPRPQEAQEVDAIPNKPRTIAELKVWNARLKDMLRDGIDIRKSITNQRRFLYETIMMQYEGILMLDLLTQQMVSGMLREADAIIDSAEEVGGVSEEIQMMIDMA